MAVKYEVSAECFLVFSATPTSRHLPSSQTQLCRFYIWTLQFVFTRRPFLSSSRLFSLSLCLSENHYEVDVLKCFPGTKTGKKTFLLALVTETPMRVKVRLWFTENTFDRIRMKWGSSGKGSERRFKKQLRKAATCVCGVCVPSVGKGKMFLSNFLFSTSLL